MGLIYEPLCRGLLLTKLAAIPIPLLRNIGGQFRNVSRGERNRIIKQFENAIASGKNFSERDIRYAFSKADKRAFNRRHDAPRVSSGGGGSAAAQVRDVQANAAPVINAPKGQAPAAAKKQKPAKGGRRPQQPQQPQQPSRRQPQQPQQPSRRQPQQPQQPSRRQPQQQPRRPREQYNGQNRIGQDRPIVPSQPNETAAINPHLQQALHEHMEGKGLVKQTLPDGRTRYLSSPENAGQIANNAMGFGERVGGTLGRNLIDRPVAWAKDVFGAFAGRGANAQAVSARGAAAGAKSTAGAAAKGGGMTPAAAQSAPSAAGAAPKVESAAAGTPKPTTAAEAGQQAQEARQFDWNEHFDKHRNKYMIGGGVLAGGLADHLFFNNSPQPYYGYPRY